MEWDEILNRSTADGAVSALILDFVGIEKSLDHLRELGVTGDYAAVKERLNALRTEFTKQFNPASQKA